MTITAYTSARHGRSVTVTATSSLTGPTFYWYANGAYLGSNETGQWTLRPEPGDSVELVAVDSTSGSFDPYDPANIPEHWPNRRTIEWTRPTDQAVSRFVVEQQKDGGAWVQIAEYIAGPEWSFRHRTAPLEDGSTYAWRVQAYDEIGNAGTVTTLQTITQYHRPNPVAFAIAYDDGTGLVTYSAS